MSKTTRQLFVFFFCLFAFGCSQTKPIEPSQVKTLAIKNVNIIDVATGEIHTNHHLLVKNGKIAGISQTPFENLGTNVEVQDANNGFLLPGLIDMHVHAYDKGAFQISLSHGVTHVRVMNGVSQHLSWRDQQKAGSWLASSMTVSSPIVHSGGDYPLSWRADTAQQARKVALDAKTAGYDLIKAYGSMNSRSLTALLDEAKKLGIPVAKHGPHPPKGMEWSALTSLQSAEHAEDVYQGILNYERSPMRLGTAIAKVKSLNTSITPTLNIFWQLTQISADKQAYLDSLPEDYISPIVAYEDKGAQVDRWLTSSDKMIEHNKKTMSFLLKVTKAMHDANIPLMVGSDAGVLLSPHGLATLNEISLMHEAGINQLNVLQAATINAAKALKKDGEIGQIKQGMNADLLILAGNPLIDIEQIKQPKAVVKDGVWLSQRELAQLRTNAIEERSFFSELWVLLTNY